MVQSKKISIRLPEIEIKKLKARIQELLSLYKENDKSIFYDVYNIYEILPNYLVEIPNKGTLKILAFSDYRIHDINTLINFIKNFKDKPDIIIYAGDDVKRFVPIRIKVPHSSEEYPPEIERMVEIHSKESKKFFITSGYGIILRLSRNTTIKNLIQTRLLIMKEMYKILENTSIRPNENENVIMQTLRRMINKYPSLRINENEEKIQIVDKLTNTSVLSFFKKMPNLKNYVHKYLTLYENLLKNSINFAIYKIGEDDKFIYFHIDTNRPKYNVFEKLASYSKYGLAAVIGNDDLPIVREFIKGHKVYELHSTWVKIGPFLIVGLEGSTCGAGLSGKYLESEIKLRLELAEKMLQPNEKLIIISHTPPRGILDRALRFGEKAIGSLGLRDFLEERDNSCLVICGHVHNCGGHYEKLEKTIVVNVSSHDSPFDPANIAWIVLDEKGNISVNFMKLPSLIENLFENFKKENEDKILEILEEKALLKKSEGLLFIEMVNKFEKKLFSDLPKLAIFKRKYGFSWKNIFDLYTRGIKTADQLTEPVYQEILNKTSEGIHKIHLMRGYAKIKREREKNKIYLLNPIPLPSNNKILIYDTEYNSEGRGVLYGFLDFMTADIQQFWFEEKNEAQKYLKEKRGYIVVHWGGADKKILRQELESRLPTLNLLYYVQTSLVAPISYATLPEVHDVLCGPEKNKWWKNHFYEMDGISKLALVNKIFINPNDKDARKQLKNANKADILALYKIAKKLKNIPIKIE